MTLPKRIPPTSPPRPTELAHVLSSNFLEPGDFAIDATCGKGFDTLHLATSVGEHGSVLALDLQADALTHTHHRLVQENLLSRVKLIKACHSTLLNYASPHSAKVIIFNLGYLPGGDHSVVTHPETTLAALDAAHNILQPSGLLIVTAYPGHPEGEIEAQSVADWFQNIASQGCRVSRYEHPFTLKPAPVLWLASK